MYKFCYLLHYIFLKNKGFTSYAISENKKIVDLQVMQYQKTKKNEIKKEWLSHNVITFDFN